MRELLVSDMELVSGGITETQCIAGFTGVGWVAGAILTKTAAGANNVGALAGIIGGMVCGNLVGADGDGE